MSTYSSQIDLTLRLIKAKGQKIVLRNITPEPSDFVSGAPSELEPTEIFAYGVAFPLSTMHEQAYASQFTSGTMIRSRTQNIFIAAKDLGFIPQEGDQADFDSNTWTFKGVKTLAPDGTPILLDCVVAR